MLVAPGMLAQAVHDDDRAALRRALGQRPVLHGEVVAVTGGEGRQRRFGLLGDHGGSMFARPVALRNGVLRPRHAAGGERHRKVNAPQISCVRNHRKWDRAALRASAR